MRDMNRNLRVHNIALLRMASAYIAGNLDYLILLPSALSSGLFAGKSDRWFRTVDKGLSD